jgi:hypothetical protein
MTEFRGERGATGIAGLRAHLGLATTRELLDELRTRFEIHAAGGLDYRTVDGEAISEQYPMTKPQQDELETAIRWLFEHDGWTIEKEDDRVVAVMSSVVVDITRLCRTIRNWGNQPSSEEALGELPQISTEQGLAKRTGRPAPDQS